MGYRGKVVEQNRARDLRKAGWTLGEICEELGVSKSSASLWCRDVAIDEDELARRRRARFLNGNNGARQRGPNKLQRRKQAEIERFRRTGAERLVDLNEREFLVAGLALYAGEGAKGDGNVTFANSDDRMIAFYLTWIRTFFSIDETRLRFTLYLHEGLDLDAANAFWSLVTGIPLEQFRKPYRAVPDPSIRRSKHPMGCASVTYSSSAMHREIMGLVDALLSSDGSTTVTCPSQYHLS